MGAGRGDEQQRHMAHEAGGVVHGLLEAHGDLAAVDDVRHDDALGRRQRLGVDHGHLAALVGGAGGGHGVVVGLGQRRGGRHTQDLGHAGVEQTVEDLGELRWGRLRGAHGRRLGGECHIGVGGMHLQHVAGVAGPRAQVHGHQPHVVLVAPLQREV